MFLYKKQTNKKRLFRGYDIVSMYISFNIEYKYDKV